MIKQKIRRFLKFVSFVVVIWILSIAYAITSFGE